MTALKNLLGDGDTVEKIKLIKEAVKNQQVHSGVSNVDHLMGFFKVLLDYIDEIFVDCDKVRAIFVKMLLHRAAARLIIFTFRNVGISPVNLLQFYLNLFKSQEIEQLKRYSI